MPTVVILTVFLGYLQLPGPQRPQQPTPVLSINELAGFQITLDVSSDRIALACERGCSWTTLTLECSKNPCRFIVTDHGKLDDSAKVSNEARARIPLFAVAIETKDDELVFGCERGCAWKTSKLLCGTGDRCESRINEYGVAKQAK